MILDQYHSEIATLTARVFLGILFLTQGYDAVFRVGFRNVIETYRISFQDKGMPIFIIYLGTIFTLYTELICGFLLIPGLCIYPCLYLLGANVLVASLAFGITTPMWDTKHVFPRLLLVLFLLLIPGEWHLFSLDQVLFNK